jgi:DNA-directed RNA polymerase subunit RPC12/RpoP
MNTIKPNQISEAEYADLTENYGGFCIECGDQAEGVEPDARRYRCEACGAHAVYGVEELLIRGVIRFTEDKHDE